MSCTRRAFMAGATAAGAALALSRPGGAAPSVFGGVEVGVQSYTFRAFDLDRMIAAMKSIGITSLELWDGHLHPQKASEADFKAVRRKLDEAGIRVSAYCPNFPTDASDEYLQRAFRGAGLLGTKVMTTSVEKPIVPRLDAMCRKHQVTLGLHNHYLGDPWYKGKEAANFGTPADWAEALAGGSEYLAINLDIGHLFAAGYDPVAYFRENHRRIVSLHIKNRDRDPERTYRPFDRGPTPVAEVLKAARELKFRYAANIEYEMDEKDPTEGVRRSFEFVKGVLAAS